MRRTRFISIRAGVIVAAALMIATAALPLSVSAHFQQGGLQNVRWFWVNQPAGTRAGLHLMYDRDCVSDWQNVDAIAASWQATATPLYFVPTRSYDCFGNHYYSPRSVYGGLQEGSIAFRYGWIPGSAYAFTQRWHCYWKVGPDNCWGWSLTGYDAGAVRINDGIDSSLIYENYSGGYGWLSANEQQDVLKHELGHSLGLEHAGYYAGESTGWYSIMDYCCMSDYSYMPKTPTSHDVGDINLEYPGW